MFKYTSILLFFVLLLSVCMTMSGCDLFPKDPNYKSADAVIVINGLKQNSLGVHAYSDGVNVLFSFGCTDTCTTAFNFQKETMNVGLENGKAQAQNLITYTGTPSHWYLVAVEYNYSTNKLIVSATECANKEQCVTKS